MIRSSWFCVLYAAAASHATLEYSVVRSADGPPNLGYGRNDEPVFFLHSPKTGGTFYRSWVSPQSSGHDALNTPPGQNQCRGHGLLKHGTGKHKTHFVGCLSPERGVCGYDGHNASYHMGVGASMLGQFGISSQLERMARKISTASASFTIIRDPVDRFISAWYHLKKAFPPDAGYPFFRKYPCIDVFVAALVTPMDAAHAKRMRVDDSASSMSTIGGMIEKIRGVVGNRFKTNIQPQVVFWPQAFWYNVLLTPRSGPSKSVVVCYDSANLQSRLISMLDKEFGCEIGRDFKRPLQRISPIPIKAEQNFNSSKNLARCENDTFAKLSARTRGRIRALYAKDAQFWEYHCSQNSTQTQSQKSLARCERWCHNHPAEWARKCAWTAGACTACSQCGSNIDM